MNSFYFLIVKLALKIIDFIPYWCWKAFFLFSSKKKLFKVKKDNNSVYIENLIWLDFDGYIGDFFSVLKSIIYFDAKNVQYTLIINHKFKGIIEDLNLRNANLIYKDNFFVNKHLNYKEIEKFNNYKIKNFYLLNPLFVTECLPFLYINQCENIYKFNPKVSDSFFMNRSENSSFLSPRYLWWTLFFLSNKSRLNIEKYSTNKNNKTIIELSNELLNNNPFDIEFDNLKCSDKTMVTLGASRKEKVLKDIYVQEILKLNNVVFSATTNDFKFIKFKIDENRLFINKSLFDLYLELKQVKMVISYDTGLYHMANFLNKEINLIINKSFISWKYMRDFWFGDANKKVNKIILDKKYFQ